MRSSIFRVRRGLWASGALSAFWCGLTALAAPVPPGGFPAGPAAPDAKSAEFFEAKVRPLLASQCFSCHSGSSASAKLDLHSREAILKGGARGPALVPGDPDKSLLVRAVRFEGGLKMPPGRKLAAEQVKDLTAWVKMGAPWPSPGAGGRGPGAGGHWAFRPVKRPPVPTAKNAAWVKTPIDAFVLSELEKRGLKPAAPADRRTLIRRVTFDLTGLPPTPEEVEAFLADRSPDAWEKVVDRLLASPAYGERWGRHWLDVVRYSDSNGLDWNEVFPNAWRYRDYVIQSFNQDKPYDQFIKEQLAGDQMPGSTPEQTYERLTATGMLVMGPKLLAQQDRKQLAMDVVDEQIDVTSKAFMGLTVSCARCHDHKFDPIPTKDYYSLAGIFKSTETLHGTLPRNGRVMYWMERPLAPEQAAAAYKAHADAVRKMQDAIKKCKDDAEKVRLTGELKTLEQQAPPPVPMAMAVQDTAAVTNVKVHIRGNHRNLGEEAPRGVLTAVAVKPRPIPETRSGRLELAEWIASPENPLTARVLVNRVWLHHFGQGLVRTPDNFGLLGERPSHPELLDWLAAAFAGSAGVPGSEFRVPGSAAANSEPATRNPELNLGWSLKRLHRLMLLSSAYQMSSAPNPVAYAKDPENRLLWRMNRHRLEAEAIRDAMLQTTGQLDRTAGGSLMTKTSGLAGKEFPVDYTSKRRSVYLPVVRGVIYDMFQVFDFPDPHVVNGRRDTTTVAPQALFMMNSPFITEQAGQFARFLLSQPGTDDARRVELAYERALGRTPTTGEVTAAAKYVSDYARELEGSEPDAEKRRSRAWESFCQSLFACTEFRYLD